MVDYDSAGLKNLFEEWGIAEEITNKFIGRNKIIIYYLGYFDSHYMHINVSKKKKRFQSIFSM